MGVFINEFYEKHSDGTETQLTNLPFDIPTFWTWCRLGEIANWRAGATPSRNNPEYYKDGTVLWLKTGDLNDTIVYEIPG